MQPVIVAITLAAFGIAAVVGGILTWRSALKLVTDARQTLHAMFGESHPTLFGEKPDPRGARIAAVGFIGFGVALLALAAIQLFA